MRVVPGVVVDERGPVTESGDLIAVVPPAGDFVLRVRVHSEPVIGLSVVVDDVPVSHSVLVRQDD